jgi:hypothetical protein
MLKLLLLIVFRSLLLLFGCFGRIAFGLVIIIFVRTLCNLLGVEFAFFLPFKLDVTKIQVLFLGCLFHILYLASCLVLVILTPKKLWMLVPQVKIKGMGVSF